MMSTFAKRKRLLMTRQLPTWGEPILPHVWKTSEEEINLKFPFPAVPVGMTRNHGVCNDDEDGDDNNGNGYVEDRNPVVSFPYQEEISPKDGPFFLQPKTVYGIEQSLVEESRQEEEEGSFHEDLNTDHDDLCSEYYSSEEAVSPTSHSSGSSSSYVFNNIDINIDIDMDINPCISLDDVPLAVVPADTFGQELVGEIIMSTTQTEPSPPSPIAWIIEAYYDAHRELCFKLQMTESGASMILMKDEILESVKIIVEKEEEEEENDWNTLFDIKSINGDSEFVELSNVLQKISDIIASIDGKSHKKKTAKRERDLDSNTTSDVFVPRSRHNHPSSSSSSSVLSSRRRRRQENQDTTTTDVSNKKHKNEKRISPFRSAWKVLAARRSTTLPPPTMAE